MEIANIEFNNGKNRFVLESITDSEGEFRFAWKGNKVSKDGFVNRPANFEWKYLAQLIRKGFESGKITETEISEFMLNLYDLKQK